MYFQRLYFLVVIVMIMINGKRRSKPISQYKKIPKTIERRNMDRITEIINRNISKHMKAGFTCHDYITIKQLIIDCINAVRDIPKPHKKIIFVSHCYSNNPNSNRLKVETICTSILRQGMFALSPLHMFSYYDNDDDRELILTICRYLIDISDEVWIYGYSEGCIEELRYALSKGKVIKIKATGEDKERLEAYIENWRG